MKMHVITIKEILVKTKKHLFRKDEKIVKEIVKSTKIKANNEEEAKEFIENIMNCLRLFNVTVLSFGYSRIGYDIISVAESEEDVK